MEHGGTLEEGTNHQDGMNEEKTMDVVQASSQRRNRGVVMGVIVALIAGVSIPLLVTVTRRGKRAPTTGAAATTGEGEGEVVDDPILISSGGGDGSASAFTPSDTPLISTPIPTTTAPTATPTTTPTHPPTANPTAPPTTSPTVNAANNAWRDADPIQVSPDLLLCDPNIQCETDRLDNSDRLELGHSLCNLEWRFGVAMIEEGVGSLVWQDCNLSTTYVLITVPTTPNVTQGLAFYMTEMGIFQVLVDDQVAWELESIYTDDIAPRDRCRSNPDMGCPYLHLRQNGGNIVMNYISGGSGWQAVKVHRSYPNLFPAEYN